MIDPRSRPNPGRRTSGFHRPGRHCLQGGGGGVRTKQKHASLDRGQKTKAKVPHVTARPSAAAAVRQRDSIGPRARVSCEIEDPSNSYSRHVFVVRAVLAVVGWLS